MLPIRAVNALIDFKKQLLSSTPEPEASSPATPRKMEPRRSRKKLPAQRGNVWQRMCQRKEWASPVYVILLAILLWAPIASAQQQVFPVSGVLTLDLSKGNNSFKVLLGQAVTSVVFSAPQPGMNITVTFTENATGGFAVTFGGNVANACTVNTAANATTVCQFTYDASTNTVNGSGSGSGSASPGVFNSNFDPPLFQNYSLTATGAQTAINLTANPIDTHAITWRPSGFSSQVSDTITYANGDLHTTNANWVYQSGSFNVSSNVAYSSAALSFAYRSDGPSAQASEFAQGTMVETVGNATQNGGICVRMSTVAQTAYCIQAATDAFRIAWVNAGAFTTIASSSSFPVTGDVLKIQAIGTTITAYKNGNLVMTVTDANIASGSIGMFGAGNANSNGISNFVGAIVPLCNITLDTSPDNGTWTIGGAIASLSCATNGSFQASVIANYVRVNVTSFSNLTTLTVVYSGRLAGAAPNGGTAPVSNGQWVQAGDVIWAQHTTQGIGSTGVHSSARILQANGVTNIQNWDITCNFSSSGGFGTGFTVTTPGWLQSFMSYPSQTGFPQGSDYVNLYVLNSMPAGGGTTGCVSVLTTAQIGMLLFGAPTGSFYPVGFVGTTTIPVSPWSNPGFTTALVPGTPAAGAELSFTFSTSARTCIQSVSFTLAAGSTNVTPAVLLTINGSKLYYSAATAQTSATTQIYSFSPGSAEIVTGQASPNTIHIVPFNNGQLICTNSNLSTATLTTVTNGLNGTTAYTLPSILVQVQQDNN